MQAARHSIQNRNQDVAAEEWFFRVTCSYRRWVDDLTVAGHVNETAPHTFKLKLKLIRGGRKLIETPKGASGFKIKPQKS